MLSVEHPVYYKGGFLTIGDRNIVRLQSYFMYTPLHLLNKPNFALRDHLNQNLFGVLEIIAYRFFNFHIFTNYESLEG